MATRNKNGEQKVTRRHIQVEYESSTRNNSKSYIKQKQLDKLKEDLDRRIKTGPVEGRIALAEKYDIYKCKPLKGEGNPLSGLMIVGEAPGVEEAKFGRPFVEHAKSGALLRRWFYGEQMTTNKKLRQEQRKQSKYKTIMKTNRVSTTTLDNKDSGIIKIDMKEVFTQAYITNVVKMRPHITLETGKTQDIPPSDFEVAEHLPILQKEMQICEPKLILCFGKVAYTAVINSACTGQIFNSQKYENNPQKIREDYQRGLLPRIEYYTPDSKDKLEFIKIPGVEHATYVIGFSHPSHILRMDGERSKIQSKEISERIYKIIKDWKTGVLRTTVSLPLKLVDIPREKMNSIRLEYEKTEKDKHASKVKLIQEYSIVDIEGTIPEISLSEINKATNFSGVYAEDVIKDDPYGRPDTWTKAETVFYRRNNTETRDEIMSKTFYHTRVDHLVYDNDKNRFKLWGRSDHNDSVYMKINMDPNVRVPEYETFRFTGFTSVPLVMRKYLLNQDDIHIKKALVDAFKPILQRTGRTHQFIQNFDVEWYEYEQAIKDQMIQNALRASPYHPDIYQRSLPFLLPHQQNHYNNESFGRYYEPFGETIQERRNRISKEREAVMVDNELDLDVLMEDIETRAMSNNDDMIIDDGETEEEIEFPKGYRIEFDSKTNEAIELLDLWQTVIFSILVETGQLKSNEWNKISLSYKSYKDSRELHIRYDDIPVWIEVRAWSYSLLRQVKLMLRKFVKDHLKETMKFAEFLNDPIMQFTTYTGIKSESWLQIPPDKVNFQYIRGTDILEGWNAEDMTRESNCDIQIECSIDELNPSVPLNEWDKIGTFVSLSYDIEMGGTGIGRFPDAVDSPILCFCWDLQIFSDDMPKSDKGVCRTNQVFVFHLRSASNIDSRYEGSGVSSDISHPITIHKFAFNDESEMLKAISYFLFQVGPDNKLGHHNTEFDDLQTLFRSRLASVHYGYNVPAVGKTPNLRNRVKLHIFNSAAYQTQYLHQITSEGVCDHDTRRVYFRETKMPDYRLQTIVGKVIGDSKAEMAYNAIDGYFWGEPEQNGLVIKYCIKDARLPHQLFTKDNWLTKYVSFARICGKVFPWEFNIKGAQVCCEGTLMHQIFRPHGINPLNPRDIRRTYVVRDFKDSLTASSFNFDELADQYLKDTFAASGTSEDEQRPNPSSGNDETKTAQEKQNSKLLKKYYSILGDIASNENIGFSDLNTLASDGSITRNSKVEAIKEFIQKASDKIEKETIDEESRTKASHNCSKQSTTSNTQHNSTSNTVGKLNGIRYGRISTITPKAGIVSSRKTRTKSNLNNSDLNTTSSNDSTSNFKDVTTTKNLIKSSCGVVTNDYSDGSGGKCEDDNYVTIEDLPIGDIVEPRKKKPPIGHNDKDDTRMNSSDIDNVNIEESNQVFTELPDSKDLPSVVTDTFRNVDHSKSETVRYSKSGFKFEGIRVPIVEGANKDDVEAMFFNKTKDAVTGEYTYDNIFVKKAGKFVNFIDNAKERLKSLTLKEKKKYIAYLSKTFDGAIVFEVEKGFCSYGVITLDFSSLYPSIMIAHNYSTETMVAKSEIKHRLIEEFDFYACICKGVSTKHLNDLNIVHNKASRDKFSEQLYSLRQYYQLTVYEDQPDFKEYLPFKHGDKDNLLRVCKSNLERISKIDTPYFDGDEYLNWFTKRYGIARDEIGEDFTLENLRTHKQNVVYLSLDESMGQGLIPKTSVTLIKHRNIAKGNMKSFPEQAEYWDGCQLGLKKIGNSTYGFTAAPGSNWCDPRISANVTAKGQVDIKKAVAFSAENYKDPNFPLNRGFTQAEIDKHTRLKGGDTDSCFNSFVFAPDVETGMEFGEKQTDSVKKAKLYEKPQTLEFEKVYSISLFLEKKHYVAAKSETAENDNYFKKKRFIETSPELFPPQDWEKFFSMRSIDTLQFKENDLDSIKKIEEQLDSDGNHVFVSKVLKESKEIFYNHVKQADGTTKLEQVDKPYKYWEVKKIGDIAWWKPGVLVDAKGTRYDRDTWFTVLKAYTNRVMDMDWEEFKVHFDLPRYKSDHASWVDHVKIHARGIDTVRRSADKYLKETLDRVIKMVLLQADYVGAGMYIRQRGRDLLNGNVPFDNLIFTANYGKPDYRIKPAHVRAIERVREDLTCGINPPEIGDRFSYIIIKDHNGKKSSDRSYHPEQARKRGYTPDYEWYFERFARSLLKFTEHFFDNSKALLFDKTKLSSNRTVVPIGLSALGKRALREVKKCLGCTEKFTQSDPFDDSVICTRCAQDIIKKKKESPAMQKMFSKLSEASKVYKQKMDICFKCTGTKSSPCCTFDCKNYEPRMSSGKIVDDLWDQLESIDKSIKSMSISSSHDTHSNHCSSKRSKFN